MIASQIEASTRSDVDEHVGAAAGGALGRGRAQRIGHAQPARHARAGGAAHRLGAHLGEPAGAVALEARVEVGGDGEAQDDVPQEGEALVGVGAVLDPGGVGEGLPPQVLRQLGEQRGEGSQCSSSAAWAATKSAAWPTVRILVASSSGMRTP